LIFNGIMAVNNYVSSDYIDRNIDKIVQDKNLIGVGCSASVYKFKIETHEFVLKKFTDMKRYNNEKNILGKVSTFDLQVIPKIHVLNYKDPIIVMDYAGKELGNFIEENQKNRHVMKYIVQEIFNGIFTLHERGLVHGDLHAGNIMVKGEDIFFVDFGDSFFSTDIALDIIRLQYFVLSKIEAWRTLAAESVLRNPEAFKIIERIYDDPGIARLFNFVNLFNAPGVQYIVHRMLRFSTNMKLLTREYVAAISSA
ncbi:hypothetical protein PAEPH01_2826, partial [Pancytospora epiphaga]